MLLYRHVSQETSPAANWSRFGQAIRLTLAAYVQWFPEQAASKGLTTANLNSEMNRRISAYVDKYFDSKGFSGGLGAIIGDAARQCALGNTAACQ